MMPYEPHSRARERVMESIAALAAEAYRGVSERYELQGRGGA